MAKNAFDKLKDLPIQETAKQKVVPIKSNKRDNEQSYMLWLDKDILKRLKVKAIEQDTNVKSLIEEALRRYL